MGIAGIWTDWKHQDGRDLVTFAMLTVNADGHPIFQRMHRPEDEKRMVVILDQADYGRWLGCPVAEAGTFFRQWPGELRAEPRPTAPRAPRAARTTPPPVSDPGLF